MLPQHMAAGIISFPPLCSSFPPLISSYVFKGAAALFVSQTFALRCCSSVGMQITGFLRLPSPEMSAIIRNLEGHCCDLGIFQWEQKLSSFMLPVSERRPECHGPPPPPSTLQPSFPRPAATYFPLHMLMLQPHSCCWWLCHRGRERAGALSGSCMHPTKLTLGRLPGWTLFHSLLILLALFLCVFPPN